METYQSERKVLNMIEKELEDEYVTDRMGTVWRAIEVFKTGETQGVRNERQRIIKLLESIAITTKNDEVAVMELLSAIVALIKGEQK